MRSRQARVVRGLTAAGFATFVAAFSHVAVGGASPGVVGLALALAFSALTCIALAGRTLSAVRLSIAVVLSQLVFHTLFSLGGSIDTLFGSAASGSGVTVMAGGHHGMGAVSILGLDAAGGGAVTGGALAGGDAMSVGDPMMMGHSWMWAAHAAAALVTIVALHRGESAVRSLLGVLRGFRMPPANRLAARVVALTARSSASAGARRVASAAARAAAASFAPPERLRDLAVQGGRMRRRGPPAGILSAA